MESNIDNESNKPSSSTRRFCVWATWAISLAKLKRGSRAKKPQNKEELVNSLISDLESMRATNERLRRLAAAGGDETDCSARKRWKRDVVCVKSLHVITQGGSKRHFQPSSDEEIRQELPLPWLYKVKKAVFTKPMFEALEVFDQIAENLTQIFELKEHGYMPRFLLRGLISRAQKERHTANKKMLASKATSALEICSNKFESAKHFGKFALNMYRGSLCDGSACVMTIMGIKSSNDILFTWLKDMGRDHCPKFIIFLDRSKKSIILAIRGTLSFKDAVLDLACDEAEFLNGYAHGGILQGAKKILKESKATLEQAFINHPSYDLIITGHSLGAGTAVLIAMDILFGNVDYIDPSKTNVRCIALAPPPVFRTDEEVSEDIKSKIEIYIHNNDCVPRLSLAVIANFVEKVNAVGKLELTIVEVLRFLFGCNDKATRENLRKVQMAMESVVEDRFQYLHHPGEIFYMFRHKGDLFVQKMNSEFFSTELLWLESMIDDHDYERYKEAFTLSCAKSLPRRGADLVHDWVVKNYLFCVGVFTYLLYSEVGSVYHWIEKIFNFLVVLILLPLFKLLELIFNLDETE